ncbi:unnamed protein product [Linum trigynum]|uniref:Uncharacterized protein n=1 Tax=Linum trigynum TaxID=586398 RepID=A0AAV2D952_9ROSI
MLQVIEKRDGSHVHHCTDGSSEMLNRAELVHQKSTYDRRYPCIRKTELLSTSPEPQNLWKQKNLEHSINKPYNSLTNVIHGVSINK